MMVFDDYDPFAWAYNQHWSAGSGNRWLPVIERLVLGRIPPAAKILDLCCGAGDLSRLLARRGYKVTGLDGSSAMLAFAREKSPESEFIQGDVRDFRLPRSFQATVCMFDSLNHVVTLDELRATFRNVYALLECSVFLFDLNTEHKYRTTWPGSFSIIEGSHVIAVRSGCRVEKRIATFDAAIFREHAGKWDRSDVALVQTWYSKDEISSTLKEVGFKSIETEHMAEGQNDNARVLFHCVT